MGKEEFYKKVRLAGMLLYIPLILATGPLAGYFLGDFLGKKFAFPGYVSYICIGIGFFSSLTEVVRIIRLAIRINK